MKDLCERAVNLMRMRRVDYGDVRVVHGRDQHVEVKNGSVEGVSYDQGEGFGVRVLAKGAWGFAASNRLESGEVERVVAQAIAVAEASGTVLDRRIALAPAKPVVGKWASACEVDPFAVALDEKLAMLLAANRTLKAEKAVTIAQCFFSCFETVKTFASTEGAFIEQKIVESGGGMAATAIKNGEMQVRSYPNSFRGNFATRGYEYVRAMDLSANAARVASEAAQLIAAPQCPAGKTTLILDGGQLALQVHESIGHPIELDRVLGLEAGFAGTSFLKPSDVGKLVYGSKHVNVIADATVAGGLGSFGYDDEGVPAECTPIITAGVFAGFLSSRETAGAIGRGSNGTMRASGWHAIPLIRMTNVNLLPGAWDLDALLADTDDGLFMSTNRSWSIDDKRLNFQFGCELAREIKGGKLSRVFKNPTYTGITPEFWGSCDAVCGPKHWTMWGTPNCGKGEPMQTAHVGHGTAPSRFRNIRVGVLK